MNQKVTNSLSKDIRWRFHLLGKVEVVGMDGQVKKFASRTAVSLLVYLAVHGTREHSNSILHELFWPESDGDRQAQNLRRAVADLRQVLEEGLPQGSIILTRKGILSIDRTRLTIDVEEFLELTQPDSGVGVSELFAAESLYAGSFAPGIETGWASSKRMELEERYGQAVSRLCQELCQSGRHSDAIALGRAAVLKAAHREDVHIALIRAYGDFGMQLEALRQFEELERIVEEAWGESPSEYAREALEAVFDKSKSDEHPLPVPPTSFIGRSTEINELCGLLQTTRLLTLTGTGGCGKTRLSLEVCKHVSSVYRDGVRFVELATLAEERFVVETLANTLGVREPPGQTKLQCIVGFLRAKQLLIVLDNCEHVVDEVAKLVTEILYHCPSVSFLATSRETLSIEGEFIYRIPSMSIPNSAMSQSPEDLVEIESVMLFVARAVCVRRDFSVSEHNSDALVAICQKLDGIPLAIELAASKLKTLTLDELNQRLSDRLLVLTNDSRSAVARHQTIHALIDWSHSLLSDVEKLLLSRIAIFRGGWTLEAAEQVCAGGEVDRSEIDRLLVSLCDKSLVLAFEVDGITRYRLLEPIRQYAHQHLESNNESPDQYRRLLRYCISYVNNYEKGYLVGELEHILRRLDLELDNIRAALTWGLSDRGDHELAVRLSSLLWKYWSHRNHIREGLSWLEASLAVSEGMPLMSLRAAVLHAAGCIAFFAGDTSAKEYAYASLKLRRELNEIANIADTLDLLAGCMATEGNAERARGYAEESLSIQRTLGVESKIAIGLDGLSRISFIEGDFRAAAAHADECISLLRQFGETPLGATMLIWRGRIALEVGEIPLAIDFAEQGFEIIRKLDPNRGYAWALNLKFLISLHHRDYQCALTAAQESLRIWHRLDHDVLIAQSLDEIATAAYLLGHKHEAAVFWGAAERLHQQTDAKTVNGFYGYGFRSHTWEEFVKVQEGLSEDECFLLALQKGRRLNLQHIIVVALGLSA